MHSKNTEKTVQKALKAVAKREGISEKSVRREIDLAIAAARENNDPAIQSLWRAMLAKIPMR